LPHHDGTALTESSHIAASFRQEFWLIWKPIDQIAKCPDRLQFYSLLHLAHAQPILGLRHQGAVRLSFLANSFVNQDRRIQVPFRLLGEDAFLEEHGKGFGGVNRAGQRDEKEDGQLDGISSFHSTELFDCSGNACHWNCRAVSQTIVTILLPFDPLLFLFYEEGSERGMISPARWSSSVLTC